MVQFTAPLFTANMAGAPSKKALKVLLEAATQINEIILRNHPEIPDIQKSGVYYKPEYGAEKWQDVLTTYRQGFGDCEDLSTWLTAQLRVRKGIRAVPAITERVVANGRILHALTKLPNGKLIDVSRLLGMGTRPGTTKPYNNVEV